MLKIFSRAGLQRIFAAVEEKAHNLSVEGQRIFQMRSRYLSTIDPVIRFLQGRDASIAYRICQSGFLPRGKHFDLNRGFEHYDGNGNTLAIHDRAKFVGTLYLYDLGELIREAIFPYFQITLSVPETLAAFVPETLAGFDGGDRCTKCTPKEPLS